MCKADEVVGMKITAKNYRNKKASLLNHVRKEIVTHPGGYYGVLRSTRVVPVIFRRQISNVAGVKYKS
jgi:hypothetical protein